MASSAHARSVPPVKYNRVVAKTRLPVVVSFAVLIAVAFGWPALRHGETDFRPMYVGARLAGTPYLYSVPHVVEAELPLSPSGEVQAFIRPPVYAALISPLKSLPYSVAFFVWQVVNLAAFAAFLAVWRPAALSVLLGCWFLPAWINFGLFAQDAPLFLLAIAAGVALHRKGHHFAAGLLLALLGMKPQVFLLIPVLLIAKHLWRSLAGLAAGAGVLLAGCYAVAGPNWTLSYFALLRANEKAQRSQTTMANLYGLLHDRVPFPLVWVGVAAALAIVCFWLAAPRLGFKEGLSLALAGSLLTSVHGFAYDCLFLFPLVLLLEREYSARAAMTASCAIGLAAALLLPHGGQAPLAFIGQLVLLASVSVASWKVALRAGREPAPASLLAPAGT